MIQYLGNTLEDFPGPANQTRCFVHTINLIAKSILRPFDTQKTNDIRAFNNIAHALADLAEGHDPDECTEHVTGANEEETDKEDKEDKEDREDEYDKDNDSNASLEPIRSMLLKVRSCFIDCNTRLSVATTQLLRFLIPLSKMLISH